jgi:hypothetical protein
MRCSKDDAGLAYIYLSYDGWDEQDISNIALRLLHQLLLRLEVLPSKITQKYDELQPRGQIPGSESLLDFLLNCSESFPSIYIVIDALDECNEMQLASIVSMIVQLSAIQKFKIFATSRHHPSPVQSLFARGITVEIDSRNHDIEDFLDVRLNGVKRMTLALKTKIMARLLKDQKQRYVARLTQLNLIPVYFFWWLCNLNISSGA